MSSLNKVILIGNLTRDPELRYTPSGTAITKFGLATNRKFKKGEELKEEVCFVDITVWGRQAESCSEYLSKGRSVCVEGRLSFSQWETEDGQKRSKLEVVGERVLFLGGRGDGGQPKEAGIDSAPAPSDDDVPF
ncbi:Single-stranded DNA-binding protein [hydrothermal vent metagenome]|uniref:Single-stranded DNA-binding protein n=1 Tax=hydrothermal vent metagenome TaxID=652676 RepID=A0A3B1CN07_9ZZZZ